MKKLLLIPAFMAMFMTGSVAVPAAFAAQPAPPQENKMMLPPPKDGKRPPMPPRMRRPQLSNAEAAEKLQSAYGYRYSDMLRLLNIGHSYSDMNTACLYAYLSGEPVEKVLQLRQPATWGRVRAQLGLTPKLYAEKYMEYQASYLPADSLVDRETALKYLRQGYPLGDIQQAAKLARESGKLWHRYCQCALLAVTGSRLRKSSACSRNKNRTNLSPSEDADSVAVQVLPACIRAT